MACRSNLNLCRLDPTFPDNVLVRRLRTWKYDSIVEDLFEECLSSEWYLLEIVGLASVPICVGDGFACTHPEEFAFLSLICP